MLCLDNLYVEKKCEFDNHIITYTGKSNATHRGGPCNIQRRFWIQKHVL